MQAYWNSGILLNTLWENRKCIMEKLERLNRNHSQFMKSWNQTYIILNQVEPILTRLLTYFLLMIHCINEEKLTKSNWLYRNVKGYCLILCNQIIFHTGKKITFYNFFFFFWPARSNFILIAALRIKLLCTSTKKLPGLIAPSSGSHI